MSCQVEQIADCGDISCLSRALFIPEREDTNWLSQCSVSLSSCGNLLSVGFKNRLCILTTQWISSTDTNMFLLSWSGTLSSNITALLVLPISPSKQSSQNGPDWFCIVVGFQNGSIGFYTNTGHLLLLETLEEKPVIKISCHTGTYGTMPDDIHVLYQSCVCIISGSNLFLTLRNSKASLAKVQAGIQHDYAIEPHNLNIRKWMFLEQELINDAAVVGLELKNAYDHLLAASTYGGYDTWYRSIPPVNTLILGTGIKPYVGFHYALEGGNAPPLQDVARAVANKIKSALPGWLGGASTENSAVTTEPLVRSESLAMRNGLYDTQRYGTVAAVSPDRRLAAFADNLGRVAVLDVTRGHLIRLFKGYRDAQCAFIQESAITIKPLTTNYRKHIEHIYFYNYLQHFLQVFEQNKKPQLSIIKEVKRAIFLIIYNPKKGLIDIRLMQRGNRVAVFTATKNGKLIYNTCGLVGAEKIYTQKRLNVPEFQCVMIDPDGKLKKFNIPFFYVLEGEHSDKSKDFHILRELNEYVKRTPVSSENFVNEILGRVSGLASLEIKKKCLEMLIKNNEILPEVVMMCLEIFWDTVEQDLNDEENKIKNYFINLVLITLFYKHIHNESTDVMESLTVKVNEGVIHKIRTKESLIFDKHDQDFQLLEDDNCILERLLILAQEKDYKNQQHLKVTFADSCISTYKEFVSCFLLEDSISRICLKPSISVERLSKLAIDTFKSIFTINDLSKLSDFIIESNIEPKDIVRLIIVHLMDISIEELSVELIEKLIAVFYHICIVDEEATNTIYNDVSPWWQGIRDMLVDMPCPLRSMVVAMACKAVSKMFENSTLEDEAWESVTTENAKWGILVGKLEDISILSIVLMLKETFIGESLPKLEFNDYNINLKYIYTRGKGSVTELIAKWLCSMGVIPEAVVANELIEIYESPNRELDPDDEGTPEYFFMINKRQHVDDNAKIFKWLSLLRRQFPLSTAADYIIANMCWEYAMEWQKEMRKTNMLMAVINCLKHITNLHLRLGLFTIIWSTYIKHTFEASCRLVNKVGKCPKEALCLQDIGMNDNDMVTFFKVTTSYLNEFLISSSSIIDQKKQQIHFEKIWDENIPSLVEVAQDTKKVNNDMLNLNYQISCTIYCQCHFNIKFSKPLDSLYDIDYQNILEALTGNVELKGINLKASEKVRNSRMKYLTKIIRAAIETIICENNEGNIITYNNDECLKWIETVSILSELWDIEDEFVRRQQVIGLYHLGYDSLTADIIPTIHKPEFLLSPLLAITIQRLKRSLEHTSNPPEWIASVPTHLYNRIKDTVLDTSIPAHPSLTTTVTVLQSVLCQINIVTQDSTVDKQNVKLAQLIIKNCEVLLRNKID